MTIRSRMARAVVLAAALTTIATSRPENPRIANVAERDVEAGEIVRMEFVLDEAATAHADAHPDPLVRAHVVGPGGTLLDAAGERVTVWGDGWSTHPLDCKDVARCRLLLRYEVGEAPGRLHVDATAEVEADGRLFQAEDRRFPEGASFEIRFVE